MQRAFQCLQIQCRSTSQEMPASKAKERRVRTLNSRTGRGLQQARHHQTPTILTLTLCLRHSARGTLTSTFYALKRLLLLHGEKGTEDSIYYQRLNQVTKKHIIKLHRNNCTEQKFSLKSTWGTLYIPRSETCRRTLNIWWCHVAWWTPHL